MRLQGNRISRFNHSIAQDFCLHPIFVYLSTLDGATASYLQKMLDNLIYISVCYTTFVGESWIHLSMGEQSYALLCYL